MDLDAGQDRPPFAATTTVTFAQDLHSMGRMNRSIESPMMPFMRGIIVFQAIVGGVLLASGFRPPFVWWLFFTSVAVLVLRSAAVRQAHRRALAQQSNSAGTVLLTVSMDHGFLDFDAGWQTSRHSWDGFSNYYVTKDHLILCRGTIPCLGFSMDQVPADFIAGVVWRLDEAGVMKSSRDVSGVQIAIVVLFPVMLLMNILLIAGN